MTVPTFLLGRKAALTALALGVVLVLALAAAIHGVLYAGSDETTADAIQQLAALQAQAAALPDVERALDALRAQAKAQPSLLQGESDALAQAALQTELKRMVESNGGEVRSAYALPTTSENGLSLISVQYDITIPVTKLRDLAYAIEDHLPYLFLAAVDVSPPQSWPADNSAPEPRLEVRWTISAYRRAGSQ
jgi:hypothetical protein